MTNPEDTTRTETRRKVARLMAKLHFAEPGARTVLLEMGFPPNLIPRFTDANEFWATLVLQLDQGFGMADGIPKLIEATASVFPGNEEVQALHAVLSGQAAPDPAAERVFHSEGPCPTLMLIGADLPDQFLQVVRDQVGTEKVNLLYVSKQQCAVEIPDPGDGAAQLQHQIQELMQTFAPGQNMRVSYERYNFRPYLYSNLTVVGPDTTPYLLQSVPATLMPSDIAVAIVQQTSRAMSDRQGGTVSTVLDAETPEGRERLDPDLTLHENNVRDNGKLRVGTKVVAGAINPEQRMQAQLRMRAQIRRYELNHPSFKIIDYDNEDLPNKITIALDGPGLAPPEDLDTFLASAGSLSIEDFRALPWEQLRPVRIGFHRFNIFLTAMFPVVAPYVVWHTPVFHPNIWRSPQPGIRPGTVCLGPLMEGYRPDLDFSWVCQLLVDIGTYRNYEVVEASTYPDPPAALWARTEAGQQLIQSIGGPAMRVQTTERPQQDSPALWLTKLAGSGPDEL